MTRHDRRTRLLALAFVAAVAVVAAPSALTAKAPTEEELLKRIDKGGTAMDHEALASYYRKLAEEYDAMAKLHGEHAAELRKKK